MNVEESEKERTGRRRWMKQGGKPGKETKKRGGKEEEARTVIHSKCAARLSYQGDRCIIIG